MYLVNDRISSTSEPEEDIETVKSSKLSIDEIENSGNSLADILIVDDCQFNVFAVRALLQQFD